MMSKLGFVACLVSMVSGCGGSDGEATSPATELRVSMVGAYDAYPHQDGLTGQTAREVSAGVRSLELIDDAGGVWTVLEASPANVSVSYTDAQPTTLAIVGPSLVRPGHYVKARLVQDWSRFEVDATLHQASTATPGRLRVLMATSDGAQVDGQTLKQGHYRHVFVGAGADRSWEGASPVPQHSTTAEAEAFDESGSWAVYFPIDLQVPAGATGTLSLRVNLDQAFRWSNLGSPGHSTGAYDIAPPLYEPVEQFGGNRFDLELVTR